MIILAMNHQDSMFDSARTTLMSKYVMYLHSIEEAISNICAERKRLGEDEIEEDSDFTQIASPKSAESIDSFPLEQGFKPLPFEEEVSVRLLAGQRIDIRLATVKCKLVRTDAEVQFIENTNVTVLDEGTNIVGRGPDSTVKLEQKHLDVSRTHLQIIIDNNQSLRMIDMSSAGTYTSADFIG